MASIQEDITRRAFLRGSAETIGSHFILPQVRRSVVGLGQVKGERLPGQRLEIIRPVGKNYPLPVDFQPQHLLRFRYFKGIKTVPGYEVVGVHPEAGFALERLVVVDRKAGVEDILAKNGYRSYDLQKQLWQKAGGEFGIVTGRSSNIVQIRAKELNIQKMRACDS